jgi:hypothetical protein
VQTVAKIKASFDSAGEQQQQQQQQRKTAPGPSSSASNSGSVSENQGEKMGTSERPRIPSEHDSPSGRAAKRRKTKKRKKI